MQLTHSSRLKQACVTLFLCIAMACGGGGGGKAPGTGTGSGNPGDGSGGSGTTSSSTSAPPAIYPIQHHYVGAQGLADIVPFTVGLAFGEGKFFFMDNGQLQTYDPTTGAFAWGPRGAQGAFLVYEKGPCLIGGGLFPSIQTLVNGQYVTFDLYQVGGDYGFVNSVTSDGLGHLLIVCEGHRALDAYAPRGATVLKVDLATNAITPYPFRPWGAADDARSVSYPYSDIVYDATANSVFVLSYYHNDITRIDLATAEVTHLPDSRIAMPSNLVSDGKGGVLADQAGGLVHLSSQGTYSSTPWPSGFVPVKTPTFPIHAMARDSAERTWVMGDYGQLVCMPGTEASRLYQFSYAPGGSDGALYPGGLIWNQDRLWVISNGNANDAVGNFLEYQVPPSGSLALPNTPTILRQPSDLRVGQYQAARVELQAAGNGTLTYQWLINGSPIPWATASFYDVKASTGADVGRYTCRITNWLHGRQSVLVSNPASLAMVSDPMIPALQLSSTHIRKGQTATVTAWFSGGTGLLAPGDIPVVAGVPVAVAPTSSTTYLLKVTNSLGASATASATLTVNDSGRLITSLTAAPSIVDAGLTTSLAWFTSDPSARLTLQDDLGLVGPLDMTGQSVFLQTPTRRQTYTLTASLGGDTATATVRAGARGLDLLAGHLGGQGQLDGQGVEARMSFPGPMAVKPDGTLVFADQMAPVIRQSTPRGQVTTLCGRVGDVRDIDSPLDQARFIQITGLAYTPDGTLFILDHGAGKLKKLTSTGNVATVMTLGGGGSGAILEGMTSDGSGNLYIPLLMENRVVKVTPAGVVTTVVSNVTYPSGVALQPDGTLNVLSGMGGFTRVKPDGSQQQIIPVVAVGEPGEGSTVFSSMGIASDTMGTLYLSGPKGVYSLDAADQAHPLCQTSGSTFGTGYYTGVIATTQGYLWVAHVAMGAELMQITPGAPPVSIAGLIRPYADHGATVAPDVFAEPQGLAQGPDGTVLVADAWLGVIRSITPSGRVQELALGTQMGNLDWTSLWADGSGRVYFSIANSLRRFDPGTGVVTPLVGGPFGTAGIVDGTFGQACIGELRGMVGDHQGNLYFLDTVSEADSNIAELYVRKLTPDGAVVTLAGGGYGFSDATGPAARFASLRGIALEPSGNLIVVDTGNHAIRRVTPEGVVTTVAGGTGQGFVDGIATKAQFNRPSGVAVDAQGTIFVADTDNAAIRVITTDGQVSTLMGGPIQLGTRAGALGYASLYRPHDLLVNPDGDLIVTDSGAVLQFTAPLGH
jgi:sugar lactone lactonase YvrE